MALDAKKQSDELQRSLFDAFSNVDNN